MAQRAGRLLIALLVVSTATGADWGPSTHRTDGNGTGDNGGDGVTSDSGVVRVEDEDDIEVTSDSGLEDVRDIGDTSDNKNVSDIETTGSVLIDVNNLGANSVVSDSWVKDVRDSGETSDSGRNGVKGGDERVQCRTVFEEEAIYECGAQDGAPLVLIQAKKNQYVKFTCKSPNATCEHLPHLNLADGDILDSVSFTTCPSALTRCAFAAVNASGAGTLWLARPADELLPAHVAGLRGVDVLSLFEAERVQAIPVAAIRGLPALRKVRVNGARLRLAPRLFLPPLPLTFLLLSEARVEALPDGAFRGLPALKKLLVYKNSIAAVGERAFDGLGSLEELCLDENGLEEVKAGVLRPLGQLRQLLLNRNRLKVLPTGAVANLPYLEKISISDNGAPLAVLSGAFSDLPGLNALEMSRSRIAHLAPGFIANSSLALLDLSRNAIALLSRELFSGLTKLEQLDLSGNLIEDLPPDVFRGLRALRTLRLERNRIQVLPDELFSGLTSLRSFAVDQNRLHRIAPRAVAGAPLQLFSASRNSLTLAPPSGGYLDFVQSPLHWLTELRDLRLAHNNLTEVFQDWRNVLLNLKSLDLSYNSYQMLLDTDTQFLSAGLTVDLRHNNLSVVNVFAFPPETEGRPPPANGTNVFLLDDNPLVCDCGLTPLKYLENGGRALTTPAPDFRLGRAVCAGPPPLEGRLVGRVAPHELQCPLDAEDCPAGCECILKSYDQEIVLTCAALPRRWPDSLRGSRVRLSLRLRNASLSAVPPFVSSLDLSRTGLRDPDFRVDAGLRRLDLSGNRIRVVPGRLLRENLTLRLAGNPLGCECDDAESVRLLKAAQSRWAAVADFANVTCAGGTPVADVSADALCGTRRAVTAASLAAGLLLLGAVAVAALARLYGRELLVLAATRGWCAWLLSARLLDADKEFDVFVSFSHKDERLVLECLVPRLEGALGQRVCVHSRDWVVGDLIPAQILRSVERSRRTLIVLSRAYLSSAWASLEFRAAHHLALREGRARVLLVVLDEAVLADPGLGAELRAYVATNTYLLYSDVRFWERLRRALPGRAKDVALVSKLWGRKGAEGGRGAEAAQCGPLRVRLNSSGQLVNDPEKQ